MIHPKDRIPEDEDLPRWELLKRAKARAEKAPLPYFWWAYAMELEEYVNDLEKFIEHDLEKFH